jgi:hypothetical protein
MPAITARTTSSAPNVRYACLGIATKIATISTMPNRLSVRAARFRSS